MTQKISSTNIETATLSSFTGPTISSIAIANSTYVILDDTAVSNAGGYAVITGSNFASGAQVLFGSTSATSVTYVNSTTLNVQVPALTAGSYVVYVQNGDGSTAIRLNGITSSPIPVWSTGSTLTQQDTGVAFSISLSATSDSNTTFALSSGSTLPPGTTLAANGVFSGTVSVESETIYNFSVDAIDEQNQDTQRSFSVTISIGDLYYRNTVLHLNSEISNNTWITDISSNSYVVTVTADSRPSSFSPFKTTWSNYFDGTGDYLSLTNNAALNPGTSDFVMEAWVYITGLTAANQGINGKGTAGTDGYSFYVTNGLVLSFIWNGTGGSTITAGTLSLNRWHHVAVVRNSGVIRLYLDGVGAGSSTACTTDITSTATKFIGQARGGSPILGYISNYRMIKGSRPAGYDATSASLTVPTSTLTAISNTSLLTCQSNRFIDNSTNNFAISKLAEASIRNFSPFVETDITTGSGYFDGTGDFLTVANNPGIQFSTGEFTIEFWMYRSTNQTAAGAILSMTGAASGNWAIVMAAGQMYFQSYYATTSLDNNFVVATSGIPPFTWAHVAYVRVAGGSSRFYVNGVAVGSPVTDNVNYAGAGDLLIGGVASGGYGSFQGGYISNLRITKGAALYTSNFTPPTTTLTASLNTSLLLLQSSNGENNNRFVDESGINSLITRAGNASQGTFSPFAVTGWSGYFTGSSTSYISTPSTTLLNQGQTYTVQCWIYPTSFTTSTSAVRRMYLFVKGIIYAGLSIHSDGTLGWYGWPTPGGMIVTSPAGTITTNSWQHVALVVNPGNYIKLFKNGEEVGTANYTAAGADGSAIIIGHGDTGQGTDGFIGYISNFKITQSALTGGQLDYSTTPTISSPTGSSLLTLQMNRFNDTSNNNLTITPAAAASIQPFSPIRPINSWSANTVGGSMYFDGTDDLVRSPSIPEYSFGTGDFTVELWMYALNFTNNPAIFAVGSDAGGLVIRAVGDTIHNYWVGAGDIFTTSSSVQFPKLQWTHLAWTRSGTSMKFFMNGVQRGSTVTSSANHSSTGGIGIGGPGTTGTVFSVFNGYISNVRIINGTALYTSNFTPPTSPVTQVAGTTFLLNFTESGIIDNTGKNNLETVGDARMRNNIKKYGTASIYFDGTGDYLLVPSSPNLDFGTGDFTIEMWVNFTNATSAWQAIISRAYGVAGGWRLYKHNNDNQLRWYHNLTSIILTTNSDIASGVWSHIAVVRSSGTLTIYINGTNRGSASDSNSYNPGTYALEIGSGVVTSAFPMTGYIDDLRITKGFARYTSNFTPTTAAFKTK